MFVIHKESLMPKSLKLLLVVLLSTSLVNCIGSEDSDDSSSSDTMGSLSITCSSSSDCADNSADDSSGKAYAAFLNVSCASFTGTNSQMEIWGSGSASCSGGTCTASISSWYDSSDNATTDVPSGTVAVFTYIDTNNDEEPTNGEPYECVDSQSASSSDSSVTITDEWSG